MAGVDIFGNYTLSNVPVGTRTVTVTRSQYGTVVSDPVTVNPLTPPRRDLDDAGSCSISGVVEDANTGNPIAGATVTRHGRARRRPRTAREVYLHRCLAWRGVSGRECERVRHRGHGRGVSQPWRCCHGMTSRSTLARSGHLESFKARCATRAVRRFRAPGRCGGRSEHDHARTVPTP